MSTNGVWVNGTRIEKTQVLGRGDVVKLGPEEFRFYADVAKPAPVAPVAAAGAGPGCSGLPGPPVPPPPRRSPLAVLSHAAPKEFITARPREPKPAAPPPPSAPTPVTAP